jgi:RNA polymerase-binding transcription factor DksA
MIMNKSEVEKAKAGINWGKVVGYITAGTRIALMAYGTWFLAQTWLMLTPGWLLATASVLLAFGIDYLSEYQTAKEYTAVFEANLKEQTTQFNNSLVKMRDQSQSEMTALQASTEKLVNSIREQSEKSINDFAEKTNALNQKLVAAEARNRELTAKLTSAIEAANNAVSKVENVAEQITTAEATQS